MTTKSTDDQIAKIAAILGPDGDEFKAIKVSFGRFKGKTLGYMAEEHIGYLYWMAVQCWIPSKTKVAVRAIVDAHQKSKEN